MIILRNSYNLNRFFSEESFNCESFKGVSIGGLCCLSGVCCKGC